MIEQKPLPENSCWVNKNQYQHFIQVHHLLSTGQQTLRHSGTNDAGFAQASKRSSA